MSGKQFVFSLLFKGENAGAKAAAREVEQGLDAVQGQARQTTVALKGNAETLEQEARASRKAADAARDLALAEKRVRDEAARSQGAQSPAITLDPKRVEELRERYVPMAKIQKDYAKELDQIALAERAGALTATESAMVRARLRSVHEAEISSLQRSTAALDANNKATKLSAHERRILNMQLSDTAQSLALGMPPLQVLLQQGPQITDLFGGVGDTLQAVAQAATPARLAIGGIVTTALIGVTAWNGYLKSVKEVDTAAAGLGRGMAGTRQEMEAAAQAGAEAAGISVKAARSMEAAFLRTGRIDSSNFAGLIGLSDNFAATIGADAQAAGAALSEIFADPAKGADVLYRQYGLISGATAQLAKDLSAQNRQAEAQAVLIKALPASLANAEEATTALGRAWAYVAQKAGNAGDAIGGAIDRAISGPSQQERLKEAADLVRSMEGADWSGGIFGNRTGGIYGPAYAEAKLGYDQAFDDRRRAGMRAQIQRQQAAANRLTAPALALAEASPATQSSRQQRDLSNQIAALRAGRDADGLSAEQRDDITRAIEAKSRALDGLASRQTYQNTLDQIGIQLASERNPLRQAELVLMQTLLASAAKEITWAEASAEAMRARNRVMGEAMGAAKAQSADMRVELEIRARLNTQVAAGLITAEDANRLLREEIELHPLVAAAAEANGKEQADLNKIIAERRELSAQLAREEKRAQATEALIDYGKAQAEQIARLRLEASLIGATDRERARAIAGFEAEVELRRRSTAITADQIAKAREAAEATAEYQAQVSRLSDAWGMMEGAASSAIDGVVDRLLDGDISGALEAVASEVAGSLAELSITNPWKNALLGSDLPTMSDVGGLSGIWSRFRNGQAASSAGGMGLTASSMSITTPMVQINAGMIGGQMPGGAGGLGYAGGGAGGMLSGSTNVQQQVWAFFAAKGLKPHQIAGIMGNVAAESGFNPLAVGDAGQAFGLFQHNDRKGRLFDFIGGQGNLGNVQAQLEFAWQEMMTSESGAFKRLMASDSLYDATHAFTGFERPQGYDANNPASAMHWDKRLAAAEAAMAKFEGTTLSAQAQLGTLGGGFDTFGTMLAQAFTGGGQGAGGGLFGGILGLIGQGLGIPGFAAGGDHGGGWRIVGENGPELEATGAARIFNATQTREILTSAPPAGRGGAQAMAPTVVAPQVSFVINDHSGQKIETEEGVDDQGRPQVTMTIGRSVAGALSQRGNPLRRAMQSEFGARPTPRVR